MMGQLFSPAHFRPGMNLGLGIGDMIWGGYNQQEVDEHNARVRQWEFEAFKANYRLSAAKQKFRETEFQRAVQLGQERESQYSKFEMMMDQNIAKQEEVLRKSTVAQGKIQTKFAESQGSGKTSQRLKTVAKGKAGRDWHMASGLDTYCKRAKWQVDRNLKRLGNQYDRDMQSYFRQTGAGVPVLLSAMPKLEREPLWSRGLRFATNTLLPLIGSAYDPSKGKEGKNTAEDMMGKSKTAQSSDSNWTYFEYQFTPRPSSSNYERTQGSGWTPAPAGWQTQGDYSGLGRSGVGNIGQLGTRTGDSYYA